MNDWLPSVVLLCSSLWCVAAIIARLVGYARTPQPYAIPLAPAPRHHAGVLGRLLLEGFLFRSLLRANWATWLLAVLMHYGLLFVLLGHLRLLFRAFPLWLLPIVIVSGFATLSLMAGLAGLFFRRIAVARVRYISAPSDYLHLVLLTLIVVSGALLKRVWPADLAAVGSFVRGTFTLNFIALPDNMLLWLHIAAVCLLLLIFPISKLMHGPGMWLSPTFAQRDKAPSVPGLDRQP